MTAAVLLLALLHALTQAALGGESRHATRQRKQRCVWCFQQHPLQ